MASKLRIREEEAPPQRAAASIFGRFIGFIEGPLSQPISTVLQDTLITKDWQRKVLSIESMKLNILNSCGNCQLKISPPRNLSAQSDVLSLELMKLNIRNNCDNYQLKYLPQKCIH